MTMPILCIIVMNDESTGIHCMTDDDQTYKLLRHIVKVCNNT